jgi:hypothetical protein
MCYDEMEDATSPSARTRMIRSVGAPVVTGMNKRSNVVTTKSTFVRIGSLVPHSMLDICV